MECLLLFNWSLCLLPLVLFLEIVTFFLFCSNFSKEEPILFYLASHYHPHRPHIRARIRVRVYVNARVKIRVRVRVRVRVSISLRLGQERVDL